MIAVVFSSSPKKFGYDIKTNKNQGHILHEDKKHRLLFCIHPLPGIALIYKALLGCDKEKIFFFDQTKGNNAPIAIKDHVNISGVSGLAGQTPFKSHQMFPDMSSIYRTSSVYQKKTVFTVGPKRFFCSTESVSKKIISENAGIITPMLNYLGGKVIAFGIPEKIKEKKEIVDKCLKAEGLN